MSSRPSRRGGAAASLSLTPQPKLTISVEEWEAKAPLSELHLRSINAIKLASEKVPLPLKVRQTYIPNLKYKGVFFI
jgi:conserved oligomeric Golgi complex subunit 3